MGKGRLEAFSDGVLAIIITIMVLDLKAPHSPSLESMRPLLPMFLSYVISFIFVGIYWNNHHHLFHAVQHVDGRTLWANLHLLFWLSLVPFATSWVGDSNFGTWSVRIYGCILLMAAVAYAILVKMLILQHGRDSILGSALGNDLKGKISLLMYVIGVLGTFVNSDISYIMYIAVAVMWLIPDRRIAKRLATQGVTHN